MCYQEVSEGTGDVYRASEISEVIKGFRNGMLGYQKIHSVRVSEKIMGIRRY